MSETPGLSLLPPNAQSLADALKALMEEAIVPGEAVPFFQRVYQGDPPTFNGQSPVALIHFHSIEPHRLTLGAGRNQDKWVWLVEVYISREQLPFDRVFKGRLRAVDAVRTAVHGHITLNADPTAVPTLLVAQLDGMTSLPDELKFEGTLFSRFRARVALFEQYNTPIPIFP